MLFVMPIMSLEDERAVLGNDKFLAMTCDCLSYTTIFIINHTDFKA